MNQSYQTNQQNNNNNIIVLNDIKTSFNNDFTKQKNFTFNIYSIITIISAGIKELNPSLENINSILPYLIEQLGIPFCDLLNEANIIKYYFNNYIITKSEVFKKIIFAFIEVFNYQSADKTPGDILIQFLSIYDDTFKEIEEKKRTAKNDIEQLYEKINIDYMRAPEENKSKIKNELLEKINELEKTNNYPVSTWQYFKEKITSIENNNKIIDINDIKCVNIFNFINQLINNFQSLNYFLNSPNNIINSNNEIPNEELNEIRGIPLKDRKFLYKEEQLMEEENEYTEFKNYSYPFTQEKIDEIKRQYCGFLNSHGGRIYLGITDLRVVKGLFLDYKTRDTLKNELINYTYDFYPKCRIDKINVYFIPVRSTITRKAIKKLYVIKILVMPGEPYNLYSINNKGGYISTLRLPGQCINLTAEEIHTEIMKRGELLKQKYLNEQNNNNNNTTTNNNNNNTDIREAESEEVNEENYEEIDLDEEDNSEKDIDEKNIKKKVVYVVKITNIDTSLKIKDINRYFNGCGCCIQKFPAIDGKSKGYGEIHFSKKETAKLTIQKYNNMSICGTKKILMKLKKRIIKGE